LADLGGIWDWNARKYGDGHANAYVEFLRNETEQLDNEYARGRTVPTNSALRYQLIRRRKKGHGHVVVYEVNAIVRILRYFHTAQDWRTKLNVEKP
jgi:plasmid stabilization system protein ParE